MKVNFNGQLMFAGKAARVPSGAVNGDGVDPGMEVPLKPLVVQALTTTVPAAHGAPPKALISEPNGFARYVLGEKVEESTEAIDLTIEEAKLIKEMVFDRYNSDIAIWGYVHKLIDNAAKG